MVLARITRRPPQSSIKLRAREASLRCAVCHDDLDHTSVACDNCAVTLHRDCLGILTRCPTLGCMLRVSVHELRWTWSCVLREALPYAALSFIVSVALVAFVIAMTDHMTTF
jgi:hypothetical protein